MTEESSLRKVGWERYTYFGLHGCSDVFFQIMCYVFYVLNLSNDACLGHYVFVQI